MFDKLIVSEPEGADFKNRRNYFLISSVVVGALFVTALVISIYSADIGLGSDSLDLSAMLAPVLTAEAPEPPKPREPAASQSQPSTTALRQIIMARTDEATIAPTTVSTAPSQYASRPNFAFVMGDHDTTPAGSGRQRRASGPHSEP